MGLKPKSFCAQILKIDVAVTSCANDRCSDGSGLLPGRSDAGQTCRGSSWGKWWGISRFCPASSSFECHRGGYAKALGRHWPANAFAALTFPLWISCFHKCPVSQTGVCLQKGTLDIFLVLIQIVHRSETISDFSILDWNLPIILKMVLVTEEKSEKLTQEKR